VDVGREAGALGEHGLKLHYGLPYAGCRLAWRIAAGRADLSELEPRRSDPDWPYPGCPDVLPRVACGAAPPRPWPAERVSIEVLDGDPLEPDEGCVVDPALRPGGAAMWDPEGEAEGVQIVFLVRPAEGRVRGWNRCS
jgi:hypothetical protein